jgi:hypothetical protein
MTNTNKWVAISKEQHIQQARQHVNGKLEFDKLYSIRAIIEHYEGAIERGYKGYKKYLNKQEWLKDTNNIIEAYKVVYQEVLSSKNPRI